MKRMRFLPLLLLLGILLVSCEKDSTKEWEKYYGYSLDEIKGSYTYSNISGAFDGLTENNFCHLCDDAEVGISSYMDSESSIEFKINCPKAGLNKSFTGRPVLNENGFLVLMSIPSTAEYPDYELTVYVYRNAKGEIRLHGFARHIYYEIVIENDMPVHHVKTVVNYYFDVKKG